MMKESEKCTDVLNPVPHSNEQRVSSYNILAMLDGYEKEGRDIIKADGYPLTVREIIRSRHDKDGEPLDKPALPRRIRDIMDMLTYLNMVRNYIQKNEISWALCFMAYGVQSAMKARIRPLEPLFGMGQEFSSSQKKRRKNRQIWNGKTPGQRSERNIKIVEDFKKSPLNKSSFAEKHHKKYQLKPRSIRDILSKALGS